MNKDKAEFKNGTRVLVSVVMDGHYDEFYGTIESYVGYDVYEVKKDRGAIHNVFCGFITPVKVNA